MNIVMPSTIEDAIKEMLLSAETLRGVTVERGEPVPDEPVLGGWVGVYRERVALPPRALGNGNGGYRRQHVGLMLVLQESHAQSGEDCGNALDELLQKVIDVLTGDPTLSGTVDMLDDALTMEYKLYDKSDSMYVQEVLVRFSAVTNPA
jgi:hypothetical protein